MTQAAAIPRPPPLAPGKFLDPTRTAKGEARAVVAPGQLRTLWINTGTLCNIACANCYIESSPRNDALSYISAAEAAPLLREARRMGAHQAGFTGGEPFLNRDLPAMLEEALSLGMEALVLTNAMKPMRKHGTALLRLKQAHGGRLRLRVSLDHPDRATHELERGAGTFHPALEGLRWLAEEGFALDVAGRLAFEAEGEAALRARFAALFAREGIAVDAADPSALVLFPEMDAGRDVPEISEGCWDILGKRPDSMMCASSRMVVKRRGAARPAVVACTLLPYDPAFEIGATLAEAARPVPLNHPHCARFCVLGGGSCTA